MKSTVVANKWDGRPLHKGLLVPFTTQWFDGVPDFKVVDPIRVAQCVTKRLCGLCGLRIAGGMYFIGGPRSLVSRFFTDPAMHRACAMHAYSLCPFLNGTLSTMRENTRDDIITNQLVSTERPERFGLYRTNYCQFVELMGGEVVIEADYGSIIWLKE